MSKKGKAIGLPIVNTRAAGIDIGSRIQVAAVPPELSDDPVRTFQSFTADIERMADWLISMGITTVAMESTGVYWIPVYEILEERGLAVVLANARDCKTVPGRKSDVNDAQWLQRLHACGLLRASFRPSRDIAALRAYMRIRDRHLEYAAAHMQHMQKALTLMNLQLHHVLSDISGVTGLRIIRAIVSGEQDPDVLAGMRDVRCRESLETIRAALVGNYQPEHIFALSQALQLFDAYQERIADCDRQLERALQLLNADKVMPETPLAKPRTKTKQSAAAASSVRAFGALVAAMVLPWDRRAFEAAVQRGGVGVATSLKAFTAGFDSYAAHPDASPAPSSTPAASRPVDPRLAASLQRVDSHFPPAVADTVWYGVVRTADYQDIAYAGDYLDRLTPIAELDRAAGDGSWRFTSETARYLALWIPSKTRHAWRNSSSGLHGCRARSRATGSTST
jgi:hypothetical protein